MLTKAESETGDGSGSLLTFQIRPVSRLISRCNGASNPPHGLQKTKPVYSDMGEHQENLAARISATDAAPSSASLSALLNI